MIDIQKLLSPQQKSKSLKDSIDYINNRLESYYGTEQEKLDIQRNITHAELILNNNDVINLLTTSVIESYRNTLHAAKSRLGI